ncbi:MAG: hypothetical protein ACRCXB_13120 [Aeromonadaceae bacterium]
MSSQDLDKAIKSINESASRTNTTTDFFNRVLDGGKTESAQNPLTGAVVPSVQKAVYDQYQNDVNQIHQDVSDSREAADRSESAANAVWNRRTVYAAVNASFADYQDEGRTLTPRLSFDGSQYLPMFDSSVPVTFTDLPSKNGNGTITVATDKGDRQFSRVIAEAVAREDLQYTEIDAGSFGVSASNSWQENNDALSKAITAAITLKLPVKLPSGIIEFDSIQLHDGVRLIGAGYTQTELRQRVGANKNAIHGTANDFELLDFHLNCNYFTSDWNASVGVVGNTDGNGLDVTGFGYKIDILINNVPKIGAMFRDPGAEVSSHRRAVIDISIEGRDFGKEGIVILGPNDGILRKAWIGRAGILPRPAADTTMAKSDLYPNQDVDGIVLDGVNIEIGDVHTYACWSGTGFRTRNVVRLTKGGRIISESNNSQVVISNQTYGSAFFDIRNLSLLHPNWSAPIPSYTFPMEKYDGVTIDAGNDFSCEITCKRTITSNKRVVGSTAAHKKGAADVNVLTYSNSTAPSGDTEAGKKYSGDVLRITSSGGSASVKGGDAEGVVCYVEGEGCNVEFSASTSKVALKRDSLGGSKRGNNIRGSVYRCDTGIVSVGTPTSERIDVSMEMLNGKTPLSGDAPDVSRMQLWNVAASVNNVAVGTMWRSSANMDTTTTEAKTVAIPHKFLYTPDYRQVQLTIDDRSSPTTAILQYCTINSITENEIVVAYKFSTADQTAAGNLRVNVLIM